MQKMQRMNVNYELLVDLLGYVNGAMATGKEQVRTECASLSYRLSESGFQGMATDVIDTKFNEIKSYMDSAHDYITSLINWVNTNVVSGYQSEDERIASNFQRALQGRSADGNDWYSTNNVYGAVDPSADDAAKRALMDYGRN